MFDTNNAHYLNYYVQVPLTYISSLVLTFLTFCMSGVYYYFLLFFQGQFWGFFITEWQHWLPPLMPLLFFFTRSVFFCFMWGSGVFIENLGFFDSGQILEIYVVLLCFPFKNTVVSQA